MFRSFLIGDDNRICIRDAISSHSILILFSKRIHVKCYIIRFVGKESINIHQKHSKSNCIFACPVHSLIKKIIVI